MIKKVTAKIQQSYAFVNDSAKFINAYHSIKYEIILTINNPNC